jgi:hypothetical protein
VYELMQLDDFARIDGRLQAYCPRPH